ncbi:hypothetical protein BDV96DRAFT_643499 [Lophiotrema nucula]|uniref:DUF7730 domain-containing protein n=1 Tax=Lophiotrema nucula TaxID=690887 RepID=A0A6A5ZGA5_9PLEO|nr:hypothetical protein BDV96DRAFT_643499 [Lophiotrema nucula]
MLDPRARGPYIVIAQQDSTKSPLLQLPAEIRNDIFKLVLGGKRVNILQSADRAGCDVSFSTLVPGHWPAIRGITFRGAHGGETLSIRYVCRQVYTETHLLLLSLNMIWFDNYLQGTQYVLRHTSLHAEQLCAITTLYIPHLEDLLKASPPLTTPMMNVKRVYVRSYSMYARAIPQYLSISTCPNFR